MLLSTRASKPSAVSAYVATGLLAAHATRTAAGFSLSSVHYFVTLFGNWGMCDLRKPEQTFELTQLRRVLQHLIAAGQAKNQGRAAKGRGRAGPTYALEDLGIVALVREITERVPQQSAEEALFVAAFVDFYADAITSSLRSPHPLKLSPLAVLDIALAQLRRVIGDLEQRIEEGSRLAIAMQEASATLGVNDAISDELIARFDRPGSYQLHHVRTFGEIVRNLPEPMRRREFESGAARRVRFLFEPLLLRARAEEHALREVAARYAAR